VHRDLVLFFFGFSRGAYIAWYVAQLVSYIGLLSYDVVKGDPYDYKVQMKLLNPVVISMIREMIHWDAPVRVPNGIAGSPSVSVVFVGVWDLVTADKTFALEPIDMHPGDAMWVSHAMALHERRLDFPVTHIAHNNQVNAVWFPGCHCDVGATIPTSFVPQTWVQYMAQQQELQFDSDAFVTADGLLTAAAWTFCMQKGLLFDEYRDGLMFGWIPYAVLLGTRMRWRNPLDIAADPDALLRKGYASLVHTNEAAEVIRIAMEHATAAHEYCMNIRTLAVTMGHDFVNGCDAFRPPPGRAPVAFRIAADTLEVACSIYHQ
jgi:hypothetical protein